MYPQNIESLKSFLEDLRYRFHRRAETRLDPVQFLYAYPDREDREIVALVTSSLAFGAVEQIIRAVDGLLSRFPAPPAVFCQQPKRVIARHMEGFRYRFVDHTEVAELLSAVGNIRRRYGSLCESFLRHIRADDATVESALQQFILDLRAVGGIRDNYLLPLPFRGSACKRLNLFLRWMVRKDNVDPGGWQGISKAQLIVPLDVHIYRLGLAFGMTLRKSADMKTALEITGFLRMLAPNDPLRYDFALMRFGATVSRNTKK